MKTAQDYANETALHATHQRFYRVQLTTLQNEAHDWRAVSKDHYRTALRAIRGLRRWCTMVEIAPRLP